MMYLILGIIVALIAYGINIYNTLGRSKNQYANAFAQIDVQLKLRYDLIPNLVNTVKGYKDHEFSTLEAVVKARNQASQLLNEISKKIQDGTISETETKQLISAENELRNAMTSFNLQIEAYPDLKASENFKALQEELTSIENRIAFARQAYNDSVTEFNNLLVTFPSNVVAKNCGYTTPAPLLTFEDAKEIAKPINVAFN